MSQTKKTETKRSAENNMLLLSVKATYIEQIKVGSTGLPVQLTPLSPTPQV